METESASASGWIDPWGRRDGWRSPGVTQRAFEFEFGGAAQSATLSYLHDGSLHLQAGEVSGVLAMTRNAHGIDLLFAGQRKQVQVYRSGELAHVFMPAGATQITVVDALAHAGEVHAEAGRLTAPMPGKVISFAVKGGDKVSKGQVLAVMEAMKMEHTIAAPADGVVAELMYLPGDQVSEGAELLRLTV